jgi:hypothetical protein
MRQPNGVVPRGMAFALFQPDYIEGSPARSMERGCAVQCDSSRRTAAGGLDAAHA